MPDIVPSSPQGQALQVSPLDGPVALSRVTFTHATPHLPRTQAAIQAKLAQLGWCDADDSVMASVSLSHSLALTALPRLTP